MDIKEITFAGSTVGEPWWTLGEIVARVLEARGIKVHITDQGFGAHNIRWIADGKAEIGPMTPVILQAALKGVREYSGEKYQDLTSIATVRWPSWLGLAIRHETGIVSLEEMKEGRYPMRILATSRDRGGVLDTVLRHYGMTLEDVLNWGGKFTRWSGRMVGGYVREGLNDMMLGHIYLGYTPHNRFWYEATVLYDMRFLGFDQGLIEKLVDEYGYMPATLPHGLYRGIDRDIPTVGMDSMYIYCLKSQPAELVRLIAEGLDEDSDLFMNTRCFFYYDREKVCKNPYIPLHPAAEEYYRERGYIK